MPWISVGAVKIVRGCGGGPIGAGCTQPTGTFFAGGAVVIDCRDGHCTGFAAAVFGTHVATVGVLSDEMPRRARSAGEGGADRFILVDAGLSPLGLSQQFPSALSASAFAAAAAAKVAVQPVHDPEDPYAATRASSAAFAVAVMAAKAVERSRSRGGGALAGHGGIGASKNPAN